MNVFVGASSCTSGSGVLTAGSGEVGTCGDSFAVCFLFFFRIPEGTSSSTFLLLIEDIVAEYILVLYGEKFKRCGGLDLKKSLSPYLTR